MVLERFELMDNTLFAPSGNIDRYICSLAGPGRPWVETRNILLHLILVYFLHSRPIDGRNFVQTLPGPSIMSLPYSFESQSLVEFDGDELPVIILLFLGSEMRQVSKS